MRVRIIFSKQGALRYTGHLDLHKIIERSIRRAELPLAYSQGYHPQPKLNLAAALPLGFASRGEVMDIWLIEEVDDVVSPLQANVPPGLTILEATQVDEREPSLQSQVIAAEYQVEIREEFFRPERLGRPLGGDLVEGPPHEKKRDPERLGGDPVEGSEIEERRPSAPARPHRPAHRPAGGVPAGGGVPARAEPERAGSRLRLGEKIASLLDSESLPRERRGKKYDLRPLIEELTLIPSSSTLTGTRPLKKEGNPSLFMRLTAREGATGRPEEVLDELGIPLEATRIERKKLIFKDRQNGR